MRSRTRVLLLTHVALLLFGWPMGAHADSSFEVSGRYTAQRRPRVTVLDFDDTNEAARSARYGDSVEAMLVTFLKRKSQFVVVERQKLGLLKEDWKLDQLTNLLPDDPAAREVFERIDAMVIGNVTLLPMLSTAKTAANESRSEGEGDSKTVQGQRIEIDVKLISRSDGRIIAAAQRSGPVNCLRSIVERLGIALEQEFLRPYYGRIKFNLAEPESVQVFLTPILMDVALDEEKPPAERGTTVIIGSERDQVEPWATDPTSYTIENILGGWYSMRLERPGYEGLELESSHWEARDLVGDIQVFERATDRPLARVDPKQRRFVVHIDPLSTEMIDGDGLGFTFRKKAGSLAPWVKRQYLDSDFSQRPQRIFLIGDEELELNQFQRPPELAEDETCDLFEEVKPRTAHRDKTYIAAGQTFDLETFKGGKLIFDDYHDEVIPAGHYRMMLWEPGYLRQTAEATVRDRDEQKVTRNTLLRQTQSLRLETSSPQPSRHLTLQGGTTKHRLDVPLDFPAQTNLASLPVDTYRATLDIPGFGGWQREIKLEVPGESPPIYDPEADTQDSVEEKENGKSSSSKETGKPEKSKRDELPVKLATHGANDQPPPVLRLKTQLCVGGRLSATTWLTSFSPTEICTRQELTPLLDILLKRVETQFEPSAWEIWSDVGKRMLLDIGAQVILREANLPPGTVGHIEPGKTNGPAPGTRVEATRSPQGAAPGGAVEVSATAAGPSAPSPTLATLSLDPEKMRELLARYLDDLDLLLLDEVDMAALKQRPEVATIIRKWMAHGGAILAFASEPGDYDQILGTSLTLLAKGKPGKQFELLSGDVNGFDIQLPKKKKLQIREKRVLPQVADFSDDFPWRILAFTKGHRDPRILERGKRDDGGYVAVWCDQLAAFRGRSGMAAPEVEQVRSQFERRALAWARYLMYRRLDNRGEERDRAEQALRR